MFRVYRVFIGPRDLQVRVPWSNAPGQRTLTNPITPSSCYKAWHSQHPDFNSFESTASLPKLKSSQRAACFCSKLEILACACVQRPLEGSWNLARKGALELQGGLGLNKGGTHGIQSEPKAGRRCDAHTFVDVHLTSQNCAKHMPGHEVKLRPSTYWVYHPPTARGIGNSFAPSFPAVSLL